MHPIEPILKPDQHEYHTGHLPRHKLTTLSVPLPVAHRPGTPLQGATITDVALVPQKARVWEPPVTRYTLHYSKIEKHYGRFAYEEDY